ncbi:MAG TPA: hypothetical protein VIF40_18260 [Methylosinus sp.]|jgi:hypothetical protein|uniref:hypothetical protein n=1 Tax=Methylosinus sp. TaxID=427 RepID=UPI002F92BDDA
MTPCEVGEWIIARWKAEDDPRLIIWQLAHTSWPLTRADVMGVIRAHIDRETENRTLGKACG